MELSPGIATWVFRPLIDSRQCSLAFSAALPASLLAIATLVVLGLWARAKGRRYCNTVCPVGTLLGMVSSNSLMHIDINTDRCVNCRKCEHVCKSSCIDLNDHVADMSRCVVCFNCIDACEHDAIHYTRRRHRLSIPLMMRVPGTSAAATASSPSANAAASGHVASASEIQAPAENILLTGADRAAEPTKVSRRRFLTVSAIVATLPAVNAVERHLPSEGHGSAVRPVPPRHKVGRLAP